jgi:hypothetical protein
VLYNASILMNDDDVAFLKHGSEYSSRLGLGSAPGLAG